MQTTIKNEWVYMQSPNEVWEYLTQAELIALWLMPNDFKAIPGHEFQFRVSPIPSLDLDGIFYCKVLELIPFQKLVYSWKGGPGNSIFSFDTIVEWTLEKHGKGTKLFLEQSGFNETNLSIFNAMTDGWQKQVQKMVTHLKTTKNDSTKL
jgi:uncharacterized protein YndB with AHSA1/START domain